MRNPGGAYGVYEVTYNDHGEIINWTPAPIRLEAGKKRALRQLYEILDTAWDKDVLSTDDAKAIESAPGVPVTEAGEPEADAAVLNNTIQELVLSSRAENALLHAGIFYVFELVEKAPKQLLELPGMGKGSVENIRMILEKYGLKLKEK